MSKLVAFLLVVISLAACDSSPSNNSETFVLPPNAVAENNRGVGLMGYFDYEGARAAFADLAATHSSWMDVRVNLAIATLNRQQAGDEENALEIIDDVIATDPSHWRAHYVRGLLLLNAGDAENALLEFQQVFIADPTDAYAAYYEALCQFQLNNLPEALKGYEAALELDPYLRSAYYGAFQIHRRLGNTEKTQELLDDFTRLEQNPRARLAEFKYTRMGPKGEATVVDSDVPSVAVLPDGEIFVDPRILDLPTMTGSGLTTVDIDDDGDLDLFVASQTQSQVLLNEGELEFTPVTNHPLSIAGVVAALWGDVDNNGMVDVYLLRSGRNQLWVQTESGWTDVSEKAGVTGLNVKSVDGQLFDADHDGDLDIFLVDEDGSNELFSNNLNGTFRSLADDYGLAGQPTPLGQVLVYDVDSDRDTDIIVLKDNGPHEVYLNDRLWRYHSGSAEEWGDFTASAAIAGVIGDVDADGKGEIYTVTPMAELLRWQHSGDQWSADILGKLGSLKSSAQLALLDLTGNGRQELIVTDGQGFRVLDLTQDNTQTIYASLDVTLRTWSPAIFDTATGPSIVGLNDMGKLSLWSPGSGRHAFLTMTFNGREDKADAMRSNASGIGTLVNVRIGSEWTALTTLRQWSGPGQSLQPMAVGLAGADQVDYVAMTWSDGVYQTELALEKNQAHRVFETQRQLSSCPVLFVWNGQKWQFLADVLGVGGIGFNLGHGQYSTPRPWERFLVPGNQLGLLGDRIGIKVTEPMEEIAYVDSVRLAVVDIPEGWNVVLDERMATAMPQATGDALYYRQELLPRRVYNDRGEDVTKTLAKADLKAAPIPEKDRRFVGRLDSEHTLTLEFTEALPESDLVLMVDGWVEYPYSQTGFAAWQAGATFDPPSLDAQDASGQWHTIAEKFGYPAGMPRRMSFPLTRLPIHTKRLRLRTNLEIYWDRVSIIVPEDNPGIRRQTLPADTARVAFIGFPIRHDGDQRQPNYDYERRVPLWDTRYPKGYYTAFGDATPLIQGTDNSLVIIGPGEELHLEFEKPNALEPGWQRFYVIETDGWAKDMDFYTGSGGTVAPVPNRDYVTPAQQALNDRYNTRFRVGR